MVVPMNVLLKAPEVEFYLANSGAQVLITFAMFADEALKGAEQAAVDKIYVVGSTDFTERVMPFSELVNRPSLRAPLTDGHRGHHLHLGD